ncbi:MAG: signal recognition particle-docking protein FtsY [Acidimicrobiia bacterium]
MSSALVLIAIFALAILLVALGLGLSRRAARREAAEAAAAAPTTPETRPTGAVSAPEAEPAVPPPPRLVDRLTRARSAVAAGLGAIVRRDRIDDEAWDELEETLLLADVGLTTTTGVLEALRARAGVAGAPDATALIPLLRNELSDRLRGADRTLHRAATDPSVWLIVGVNGVGKTTSIAKLAGAERRADRRVVLAAADTFRAAAGDQLAAWADRVEAEIVRGAEGADPGAVAFDAIAAARRREAALVLVDTAGRMHTKTNLMRELEKIKRVIERSPGALQEVLLVLDATTGQNGLVQAREFTDAVGVTGVVLTKLDGTAKGGIVLAVEADLGVPVKLVGVGEDPEDLVPFVPDEYVAALVGDAVDAS